MMLFSDRLRLRDEFYEWADKERFGERTPEHFLVFLLTNGLINEEKALKLVKNRTIKGRDDHEQPTA